MSHNISPLGATYGCLNSNGTLIGSTVLLDVRTDWDYNGGTTASNQVDLEGLVVHELGHATGFGLFGASTTSSTPIPHAAWISQRCVLLW